MGDGGGQPKRDLVAGLVGSTGLPSTARRDTAGLSLADILPVAGGALGANDALREGDDPRAAANAVTAVAPLAAPLVRGVIAAAPKTTAAVAGALGATMTPADAGTRLTREQRQQLEVERQRLEAQRQAAEAEARMRAQTDMERMQAEAEFQRQRAAQDAELQRQMEAQRQRDAEEAAARARDAEARMPFRERFPDLAAALPFIGAGAAFGFPAAVKAGRTLYNNRTIGRWDRAVDRAAEALPGASKPAARGIAAEMRALDEIGPPGSAKPGWGVMGASAALPAEASLIPQEYDYLMLPADDPNRQAAAAILTDPIELAKRAATGVMAGAPLAKLGSEIPMGWMERAPPIARTKGVIEAADAYVAQRTPRAPVKRKAKPKAAPKTDAAEE
ncbi:hypothetical protein CH340_23565 [Rhodoplanes serenus]|nr:hypothetical protein CH340_23565 [Rhodoplanes serenus]